MLCTQVIGKGEGLNLTLGEWMHPKLKPYSADDRSSWELHGPRREKTACDKYCPGMVPVTFLNLPEDRSLVNENTGKDQR